MSIQVKKLQFIVNQLIPEFYRTEYPMYEKFVKAFCEYLDTYLYDKCINYTDNNNYNKIYPELIDYYMKQYVGHFIDLDKYDLDGIPKIILELADASNFVIQGDITADGVGGNTGVGIVKNIINDYVLVQPISGTFVATHSVDNANPYVGSETTITSINTDETTFVNTFSSYIMHENKKLFLSISKLLTGLKGNKDSFDFLFKYLTNFVIDDGAGGTLDVNEIAVTYDEQESWWDELEANLWDGTYDFDGTIDFDRLVSNKWNYRFSTDQPNVAMQELIASLHPIGLAWFISVSEIDFSDSMSMTDTVNLIITTLSQYDGTYLYDGTILYGPNSLSLNQYDGTYLYDGTIWYGDTNMETF